MKYIKYTLLLIIFIAVMNLIPSKYVGRFGYDIGLIIGSIIFVIIPGYIFTKLLPINQLRLKIDTMTMNLFE